MSFCFICHPDFENEAPINVFHKECNSAQIPASKYQNRHILFRRKLTVPEYSSAKIFISADDYYKLYINGCFVACGPAAGYPSAYYYNELDVSEVLCEGENTFAIHTYYQGLINRVWVSGDMCAMLAFSLVVDGKEVLRSDESWLCADHTGYSSLGTVGYDTAFLECYDSASPEARFMLPEFDDSAWTHAEIYKHADYTLIKQPTPVVDVYDSAPVSCIKTGNTLRLDFGQEMVGGLCAEAEGKAGNEIILRFGEELNPDGSVRFDMRCNCRYEEKWHLSGGFDRLDQFDYKAFRYAELILPDDVKLSDIKMSLRHYPFVQKREYDTDNEDLKRIIDLCINTVKFGTQESFIDCPTREKGQYLGDAAVFGRAHAVLTGDTSLLKKVVRDFVATAQVCPGLMAVSGGSLMQEIADYSLIFPALVLWIYRFDGDEAFLRSCLPAVLGQLDYFKRFMRPDGLIENVTEKWNLVDWPIGFTDGYAFPLTRPVTDGIHNVINAYWCGFLQAVDEICRIVGTNETGITAQAREAFIKTFYNPETGLFCDTPISSHSAVHSNILPLLFGLVPPDGEAKLIDFIARRGLHSCGVYMAYFALAALKSRGELELCAKLATSPDCWLNMLSEGATTTFEAWGKDQKWNTSLFHPWATSPLIIFADGVLPY